LRLVEEGVIKMIKFVQKRDGRIVSFEKEKIINAILKAGNATHEFGRETAEFLTNIVCIEINESQVEPLSIEVIQNKIEEVLMRKGFYQTAKAFILYREKRRQLRDFKNHLNVLELFNSYIGESTWEVHENANIDYSIQGLKSFITGKAESIYWLEKVYPQKISQYHKDGFVHIHNLSFLGAYCVGWDLEDLIKRGFGGVPGKPYSTPAKHLSSLLGQMMNFLFTLQNEAAGAVAFSSFDTYLAPFVYFDKLTYKEVKQQIQEFVYNMNQTMRTGGQSPFSNITVDLTSHPLLKNRPVIVGGKEQDITYGMLQKEMDMINKALFETFLEGDGHGRPFTFPIPTINITKDFDWDNPVISPVWEATAKYGTPYFANYINSDLKPEDARSMCLDGKEEILIRHSNEIKRLPIKEVVETYKTGDFDEDGWADCKDEGLEALSLNPHTLKLEWTPIKRFLKISDNKEVEIITEDGKRATYSLKHPVPVYTQEEIKMKFAKDIQKGDYLLALKKTEEDILGKKYQKIEDLTFDEDLAKILGYFTADGNYLFESRPQNHFGEPKGLQFTFRTGDSENLNLIKSLIKKTFGVVGKERQDPRYNTYYLYIYNTEISRKLYKAGFKKDGRLPQILFNSPKSVIKSFLDFYFKGDGYEKRKEIHLNDLELSRDLVLLFSLIDQPVTYRLRERSQVIYLQHAKSNIKVRTNYLNNQTLAHKVSGWLAFSTTKVPGLIKSRMVGLSTLEKDDAQTLESLKVKESDIYLVRVKEIKIKGHKNSKEFYDIELEKNHLFVHSLGQISFNCCRLKLDTRELKNKGGGGLFGSAPLTGSVGVITVNLPRIAYLSKKNINEFYNMLDEILVAAKEGLEEKRKTVEKFTEMGLYPYSRIYLEPIKESFGHYWENHFNTVGIIGMNEALQMLFDPEVNMGTQKGIDFAVQTMLHIKEKLKQFQEETGHLFNLEATPSESTTYSLALKDKKDFPDIITAGTPDNPYYTNSTMLPVDYTDDPFEVAELQESTQRLYTGGCVVHFFVGEKLKSNDVKTFVRKVLSNFELPYITITPTFSICPKHGYIPGEHEYCPYCDEELIQKTKRGEVGKKEDVKVDVKIDLKF